MPAVQSWQFYFTEKATKHFFKHSYILESGYIKLRSLQVLVGNIVFRALRGGLRSNWGKTRLLQPAACLLPPRPPHETGGGEFGGGRVAVDTFGLKLEGGKAPAATAADQWSVSIVADTQRPPRLLATQEGKPQNHLDPPLLQNMKLLFRTATYTPPW